MSGNIPKGHPHDVPMIDGGHPGAGEDMKESGGHPAGIPKTGAKPGGDHPVNHPGTGDPMAHPGGRPGDKPGEKIWTPRLIAWEMTRSCNLDCVHCRAAARFGPYPNELNTEECMNFMEGRRFIRKAHHDYDRRRADAPRRHMGSRSAWHQPRP